MSVFGVLKGLKFGQADASAQEEIIKKCKAEFEVKYTAMLTMEDVVDWHRASKSLGSESALLLEAKLPDGILKLRQSMLDSAGASVRDRIICALALEKSLEIQMEDGNGTCSFND